MNLTLIIVVAITVLLLAYLVLTLLYPEKF